MKRGDQLSDFVRGALEAGRSKDEIRQVLSDAGWSKGEVSQAIDAWQQVEGMPVIPQPTPYVSAAEAVLYGLLFISLVLVSYNICTLGFNLIERVTPDGWQDYTRWARSDIRWSMAMLLVFGPLFLWLSRRANRPTSSGDQRRSLVRSWFASVTLIIAMLTLLGTAVAVIYALLNGDLTLRFILKAVLVAAVGALVLVYYKDELDD